MKKCLIALLALLLCTGCGGESIAALYREDAQIASEYNSFGVGVVEQKIKDQKFSASVEQMEGMDTIWTYEAAEDMTLEMTYSLHVTDGKAKLVLISPDETVTTLVEMEEDSETGNSLVTELQLKKGENRIKIVAVRNTELDLDIEIPSGKFHKLGI